MNGQKPREIAARVLQGRQRGDFTEHLLEAALEQNTLSAADRALCQELTFGVVRWEKTLDWLIARKTTHPIAKPILQELLRLGLYQIFWLNRIPNHAAVHVMVELAKHYRLHSQAGLVNAILRGYLREFEGTKNLLQELKVKQPAVGYSHPDWLLSRWQNRIGETDTVRLMEWNNQPPPTFARVNTLKVDPGKLLEQWRTEDVEYDFVKFEWFEENLMFKLKSHPPLGTLPSFQKGDFYVQDPSTILAVRELEPQSADKILDLCAAPGGKLTYIAQLMQNQGEIFAYDNDPVRIKRVVENCARLGVTCVKTISELSAIEARRELFDKILLDAPCSNTGVMRRRVDLRWRLRPEEITRLQKIQLGLLKQATSLLRPGGTLIYSTCSLEQEENDDVISEFRASHPNMVLQARQALNPFQHGVDGAYVAKLKNN